MCLVKTANHTHALADASLGFCQVDIAAHIAGREGFHRVSAHVGNLFQDRHHTPTGVIDDALSRLMKQGDGFCIIGHHKLLKNAWGDNSC